MTSHQELVRVAEELAGEFRTQSLAIEEARRIPKAISRRMAEAGFYRLSVPLSLGGLEVPPAVSSQVVEKLAEGDASCAWVAFIGMTSATVLSALPEKAARNIFTSPETMIAGTVAPVARAEKAAGGFRVTGRWQWGSGTQNADWVLGGCQLLDEGKPLLDKHGNPLNNMVIMPAESIEFLDTWQVSGLCGTGSLDYQVEALFVPEAHVVGYVREGRLPVTPLYAFPTFTFLALGIGAVCMGIARAAIDDLVNLATSKKRRGSSRTIAEQQHTQMQLAQAEADLRSARAFYYLTLDEAWQAALARQQVSLELRRNLRLATTNSVMKSLGVVQQMHDLGGGSAVYRASRLQRHLRDIQVARSHIMVSPATLETVGRLFLGLNARVATL